MNQIDEITVQAIVVRKTKEELDQQKKDIEALHNFYKMRKKGGEWQMSFKKIDFLNLLKKFGFYAYEMDVNTIKFVRVLNNTIQEVNEKTIIKEFLKHIEQIPTLEKITIPEEEFNQLEDEEKTQYIRKVTSDTIKEAALNCLDSLFKTKLLYCLTPDRPIEIMSDEKYCKYFFYKNGFVHVNKDGASLHDYSELKKNIFINQVLQRDYVADLSTFYDPERTKEPSNFEKFFFNICIVYDKHRNIDTEKTNRRVQSLKTIVGYALHNYMQYKLSLILFTDARLNEEDEANGRTGKTLLCKALGKMLNTDEKSSVFVELNGKDFAPDDKFKYAKCNLDTRLVHINDMRKYFDIEHLFNDITDGIFVKKEHEKGYSIQSKLLASSNKKVKIEGESAIDRTIIFELSEYYSSVRSPLTEFKQWFFSDDWDDMEWAKFDKFMLSCCQEFFKSGLVKADPINLKMNTLYDHTHRDFVRWFRYQFSEFDDEGSINMDRILINSWHTELKDRSRYNKKELYNKFTSDYPDFLRAKYFNQAMFTKWIKRYVATMYEDKVKTDEIRSSGADYIIFTYKEKKEII
jgi:hypothetical protein